MKTVVIKTVDGIDVMGRVGPTETDRRSLELHDALEIKYRQDHGGSYTNAVLTKYNYFGSEKSVHINVTAIICVYEVSDHYKKIYEETVNRFSSEPPTEESSSSAQSNSEHEAVVTLLNRAMSKATVH